MREIETENEGMDGRGRGGGGKGEGTEGRDGRGGSVRYAHAPAGRHACNLQATYEYVRKYTPTYIRTTTNVHSNRLPRNNLEHPWTADRGG